MVLNLLIQYPAGVKPNCAAGDVFVTKICAQGSPVVKLFASADTGTCWHYQSAGSSLSPFHLDIFFRLSQIRCADALTQNVVIDVFDELITHLLKGQGNSGRESLKCTVGGLPPVPSSTHISPPHAGVYFHMSRHQKWQIVPLIDVESVQCSRLLKVSRMSDAEKKAPAD